MKQMKRQSAFTMVELLVTIVIIAVLALAGFYALNITNTMNK
ncbi:type II secretion system protein, partial [bacterium]|nr:type II secretion system protein [bacterium]